MAKSPIKIPEKVYVGFQSRHLSETVPLGFMVPYTNDEAGKSRMRTVDSWGMQGTTKEFKSVILDNKPMIGFKIGQSIKRSSGWSGKGNSYLRVEDPRGFELEITIENFVMCMQNNIIEDGELIQECVWARDGNRNLLIPTNSDAFKNVKTLDVDSKKALPLNTVKLGDTVLLQDATTTGVYLGTIYYCYTSKYGNPKGMALSGKRHVVRTNDAGVVSYQIKSSIVVTDIIAKASAVMTHLDVERELANALAESPNQFDDILQHSGRMLGFMVSSKFTSKPLTEVDLTEMEIKNNPAEFTDASLIAESTRKRILKLRWDTNFGTDRYLAGRGYTTGHSMFGSSNMVRTTGFIGESCTVHGDTVSFDCSGLSHFAEADIARFYGLQIELKTKAGSTIKFWL